MADLRYTKDHEWIRIEGDIATVGITDHAQEQLGDVVFVELPEVGTQLRQGRAVGRGRGGQGRERHLRAGRRRGRRGQQALRDDPALVNSDAEGTAGSSRSSVAAEPRARASLMDAARPTRRYLESDSA